MRIEYNRKEYLTILIMNLNIEMEPYQLSIQELS